MNARPDPACVIPGTCTHCGQPARAATTWSHVPIRSDCQDPTATFQAATQATEPSVPITDLRPLRPYEQQQGGYWLYPPGCDVYGNGRVWVTADQHDNRLEAIRALRDDMLGFPDTRWLADQLTGVLDGAPTGPAATQATEPAIARVLRLADLIEAGAPWTANHATLAHRIREAVHGHDAGPTAREAAADDRRWWGGEKAGEG